MLPTKVIQLASDDSYQLKFAFTTHYHISAFRGYDGIFGICHSWLVTSLRCIIQRIPSLQPSRTCRGCDPRWRSHASILPQPCLECNWSRWSSRTMGSKWPNNEQSHNRWLCRFGNPAETELSYPQIPFSWLDGYDTWCGKRTESCKKFACATRLVLVREGRFHNSQW